MSNGTFSQRTVAERNFSGGAMIDRTSLRLSAGLLLVGQVLYIVVTQFHASGDAN